MPLMYDGIEIGRFAYLLRKTESLHTVHEGGNLHAELVEGVPLMRNFALRVAVVLMSVVVSTPVLAATVSLVPPNQTVNLGDPVTVDVTIAELGSFSAPSLGAFLLEVLFDDSILTFDSVSYGALLGDPLDFFATDIVTTENPGSVSLDEFSFLSDSELDALQPDSFTLATLFFTGSGIGNTMVEIGTFDVSDAVENTIIPDFQSGSVTVVPVPSSAFLLGCGLFFLLVWQQMRARMDIS